MTAAHDRVTDEIIANVLSVEDKLRAEKFIAADGTRLADTQIERAFVAALLADPRRHEKTKVGCTDLADPWSQATFIAFANVRARGETPTPAAVRAELARTDHPAAVSGWHANPDRGWFDVLAEDVAKVRPDAPVANWEITILRFADKRARLIEAEKEAARVEDEIDEFALRDVEPPPPAGEPEPEPKKKPRKKRPDAVGRAINYVARFAMHRDGPTLRRWRGDWYRWSAERGHYAEVSDERIDASLFRDFGINRPADVRDVRAALIAADDVLIDEVAIGSWIGDPLQPHDPLELAACPNGLIHLRARTLTPATPRYFATTALGVVYDPAASAPTRWLAFLHQLWPKDEQAIAALQEWFGYLLTPDTRQQKIMLLVGPKRSGKGTIMRILSALLGGDSVAAPTLASLGTNFGLWPLIGKTAAIIGDARLGGRSDIAQIVERLLSISGQDSQTIDRKHREPWTGYLSARMTIVSNELPRFTDASDALASRMLILELSESFYGREDTALTDALLAELPGILRWAIDGWDRLQAQGRFVQPQSSAKLVNDLADLASPIAAWVRSRCVRGADEWIDCDAAFRDYRTWATDQGHQHQVTQTTFGRDLKAAAQVTRKQKREGASRTRRYYGIRLREPGDDDEEDEEDEDEADAA